MNSSLLKPTHPPFAPDPEWDVEFDRTLGIMVTKGMDEGLRLLAELHSAEADERRLATLLADAKKRTTLARQTYERNRDLTRDIWDQLRQGIETHRTTLLDSHSSSSTEAITASDVKP